MDNSSQPNVQAQEASSTQPTPSSQLRLCAFHKGHKSIAENVIGKTYRWREFTGTHHPLFFVDENRNPLPDNEDLTSLLSLKDPQGSFSATESNMALLLRSCKLAGIFGLFTDHFATFRVIRPMTNKNVGEWLKLTEIERRKVLTRKGVDGMKPTKVWCHQKSYSEANTIPDLVILRFEVLADEGNYPDKWQMGESVDIKTWRNGEWQLDEKAEIVKVDIAINGVVANLEVEIEVTRKQSKDQSPLYGRCLNTSKGDPAWDFFKFHLNVDTSADPTVEILRKNELKFEEGSIGENIVKTIFEKVGPLGTVPHTVVEDFDDVPEMITDAAGSQIVLTSEQRAIVKKCSDSEQPVVCVEAGAGTGKTFTLAVSILHTLSREDCEGVIVATAHSNEAVSCIVNALLKLGLDKEEMIRLHTTDLPEHFQTPSDIRAHIRRNDELLAMEWDRAMRHRRTEGNDRTYRQMIREVQRRKGELMENLFYKKEDCSEWVRRIWRPFKVVLATTSHLLNMPLKGLEERAKFVYIDEASRTRDLALLVLAQKWPHTSQRSFGDYRQLRPHHQSKGDFEEHFLAMSAVELLARSHGVVNLPLMTSRRKPPILCGLASDIFYGGSLSTAVAILCLFAGQKRLVEEKMAAIVYAPIKDVQVMTIDSSQGREFTLVFVLTTRTKVDVELNVFQDESHRLTVAMTRAKEALVVLGFRPAICVYPLWDEIIKKIKALEDQYNSPVQNVDED